LRAVADGRWTEFAEATRPYLLNHDDSVRLWAVTAVGTIHDVEIFSTGWHYGGGR